MSSELRKLDLPNLCGTPCPDLCISLSLFSIRSHRVISDIFPVKIGVGKSIMLCFSISSIFVSDRQPFSQLAALMIIECCCASLWGHTFALGQSLRELKSV